MKIGIIGAMDVEVEHLKAELADAHVERVASTDFCSGRLGEKDVVVVKCGVGKVNAGICAQTLADHFGCTHLINTGIAGSLDAARLDIGDLVVATDCVQHDFTVEGLGYTPGLIPGREQVEFVADAALREAALTAASAAAPEVNVLAGRVASGDQFVCHESTRRRIVEQFGAMCCEMEGAAIAQAAEANGVPFAIVRAISDKPGTEGQAMDYATFERASAERCAKIVEHMVAAL
ncbi:5'-methylthioadenosine/adenosylhomocysteine nucleosidase [Olsenella sp. An293]|uniref:5'-methylthioadenosine/adenosylhomocysteine nucleosidase n=1 Tax=Olsenella sp. An293 TaxID=1965626 RepID=UPI000B3AA321|nr:5'-methylthioadenosine/adenosylhomocysteine nucleosidase [Olsenella sp. An293]OUO32406.1 5'-methylthioadenosine/S-adenosylhomocysteine nucleosidase [Olsenella sp. An293]